MASAAGPFFPRSYSWEPFTSSANPFEGLSDPIEGLMLQLGYAPGSFQSFAEDASAIATNKVAMDWLETPESHVYKADLPGMKKEDIKVEVEDGNVLKISGTRSREPVKDTDKLKWHRVERSHGQFLRRIRVPGNAEVGKVEAAVENGVLSVTLPKKEKKKSDVRSVDVHWSG